MTSEIENSFNYNEAAVNFTPDFDSLSEELKQQLEPELIKVAASGFNRPITSEFSQDVNDHIRGGNLYVVKQGDSITGFAMFKNFSTEGIVYIAGVVKKPTAPSGIIEAIVRHHLDETKYEMLTVRTQNDRVLEILADTCNLVVALDRKSNPEELDLLLRLGLVTANSDLDIEYLIHRGYYGSPMIQSGIRRRVANVRIKNFTDRLRYFDGDAAYGIGYF